MASYSREITVFREAGGEFAVSSRTADEIYAGAAGILRPYIGQLLLTAVEAIGFPPRLPLYDPSRGR